MSDAPPPSSPQPAGTPEPPEPAPESGGTVVGADQRSSTAGGTGGWVAFGVLVVLLVAVVAVGVSGSSSDSSAPTACAATVSEALDPNSVVRVLPNSPALEYANDPPSSGAFVVGPDVPSVSTQELPRAIQVGLLARGIVLVQYDPTAITGDDLALLQRLAGDTVVVAPNSELKTPVVATAWRKRQTCTSLDSGALEKFATVNANRAPADLSSTTTTVG
jgi:hypothetical protein